MRTTLNPWVIDMGTRPPVVAEWDALDATTQCCNVSGPRSFACSQQRGHIGPHLSRTGPASNRGAFLCAVWGRA